GRYHAVVVTSPTTGPNVVTYLLCSSGCEQASAWTKTVFPDAIGYGTGYLAVDSQGTPRVLLVSGSAGATYRSCAVGCDVEAHWSTVALPTGSGTPVGITMDASGRVWIPVSRNGTLFSCASGCSSAANWTQTAQLFPGTSGAFIQAFAIAPSGAMTTLFK